MIWYVLAWLVMGIAGAGFLNANLREEFGRRMQNGMSAREAREHLAFSCMYIITGPIILFTSLFLTGFWQDGWSLNGKPIPPDYGP